jgi:hypothetical protein
MEEEHSFERFLATSDGCLVFLLVSLFIITDDNSFIILERNESHGRRKAFGVAKYAKNILKR